MSATGILPIEIPSGTTVNSPPFQRWVADAEKKKPGSAKENCGNIGILPSLRDWIPFCRLTQK
jgi:hypothetical protein